MTRVKRVCLMMYTSITGEMSDIDSRIGLLSTHQNDEFVAISIKDWRCAVPILCRFLPLFFSVETGIRTVAEVTDLERGLEPTETDINIHKWGFGFSSPNPLGQPLRYDVWCVWTTLSRSRSYCTVWHFISALSFTFLKKFIKFDHFTS